MPKISPAEPPKLLACCCKVHRVNGSPEKPIGHLQMALRLRGSHWAFTPQIPSSQMLTHRPPAQLCVVLHSSSRVHCGPHPVMVSGLGKNPDLQRQMATPNGLTWQSVLGPQGYGLHGSSIYVIYYNIKTYSNAIKIASFFFNRVILVYLFSFLFQIEARMHKDIILFVISCLGMTMMVVWKRDQHFY